MQTDIYILGETPKNFEDNQLDLLCKIFRGLNYPLNKVKTKTILSANLSLNKTPTDKQINENRSRILDDINKTKPKTIIALGNASLKCIFENEKINSGINSLRGRSLMWREKDCWVIPTLLSEKVIELDNWNGSERFFKDDIKKAILIKDSKLPEIPNYQIFPLIECEQIYQKLLELKKVESFSFDIETSCQRPYEKNAKILSFSFSTDGVKGYSFLIEKDNFLQGKEKDRIISLIKNVMENSASTKIMHNLMFENEWLKVHWNIDIRGDIEDTMLQAYSLDCRSKTHNLEFKVWEEFGIIWKNEVEKYKTKMEDCPNDLTLDYNAKDSVFTYLLWLCQNQKFKTTEFQNQRKLYYEILLPASKTLTLMQIEGLLVDKTTLNDLIKNNVDKIEEIKNKLFSLKDIQDFKNKFGYIPKINSNTKDLKTILFNIKKLKPIEYTDKGNPSQDQEFLEHYANLGDEFCKNLLEYREFTTVNNRLQKQFTECIFSDGKYHPNFNLTFTVSGRLSANFPSMQNIDKRKHPEIRQIIIAPNGYVIMTADQGQLEARNIAMISKDQNFINVIKSGYDIHLEKAKELYGKDAGKNERFMSKNSFVFPSFYGASYKSCAKNLGLSEYRVKVVQDRLWQQFPTIKKWQRKVKDFYDKYGYVESITGRRRLGPMSYNEMINHQIQGPSSDIVVMAMNNINSDDFKMVLTVHDELVFYVKEDKIKESYYQIKEIMEGIKFDWMLDVPLQIECKVGYDWYNLISIEEILK